MPDLIGTTLDDYRIEGLLGRGSMANVYQAQQLSLPRRVALKVLKKDLFTPGDNVTRFLREIESLARLEHPHIVPIYGAGRRDPYHYLAMRLVRHGTLAQLMRGPTTATTALRWGLQICKALAHAHAAEIIHRDLKPSNILVQDGSLLLADFGLARLRGLSTLTQGPTPLGTPLYMAPEQTRGEAATPASDCFALGVLLFELLTGRHPFATDDAPAPRGFSSMLQLFERIQTAAAPLERIEGLSLGPAVRSLLSRALEKDPARRYADGMAMLSDFAALQEDPWAFAQPPRDTATEVSAVPIDASATEAAAPAQPTPKNGSEAVSFGRYRILRELGHGGQGVVHEAFDPVLERRVALKVLQKGPRADERLQRRFMHEARVAASLSHPNIIQIYEFGVEGGAPFLTMPLLEGPSLDLLLERQGPVPLRTAMILLQQIVDALDYAHASGVLHLDVKPGNLVLGRSWRSSRSGGSSEAATLEKPHVILTDFTLSRLVQEVLRQRSSGQQATEPRVGPAATLRYAAPELLDPDTGPLGPAADYYSVGVVLHELLTGKPLFPKEGELGVQAAARATEAPPPSNITSALPPQVDDLCQGLLRRDPGLRLCRGEEILDVVSRLLE